MAQTARQTLQPEVPDRVRRDELIRPPADRRQFPVREAQRHLEDRERHWAPIAYAVFLAAILVIFFSAYTTYAFSRYKDVILPGVYVDNLNLGGMTHQQANRALLAQIAAVDHQPITITYRARSWTPRDAQIGYTPDVAGTLREAEGVGRSGGFLREFMDRMPMHPRHFVPLLYALNPADLRIYLQSHIASQIYKPKVDATLTHSPDNHIVLVPSEPGVQVDIPKSIDAINAALGHVYRSAATVQVDHLSPTITDEAALAVRDRVERFLARPPVIKLGKLRIVTSRVDFVPMLGFKNVIGKSRAVIEMQVNADAVHAYVAKLAGTIDRPAENAKLDFSQGHVQVISPRRTGRTLDQAGAYNALTAAISKLKPGAHLAFTVAVTQPPIDLANPASVGINTLLAAGQTSFSGAAPARLRDITLIAKQLDGDLLPPDQLVSFNTLAGTNWDPRVYEDQEAEVDGQVAPGSGGAMQQVATTFLRALYGAGLTLKERHAHSHRLAWYEPPVGYDALVAPDRNWDLVFLNNTHKYLLIKTRVEPVRQELYIYVYGPKLKWSVAVDKLGKIAKIYRHPPKLIREDPSMAPGELRQVQWAHNGADVVLQRTITLPNGKVQTDEIDTHYQPWQAVVLVGNGPAAQPTATAAARGAATKPTQTAAKRAATPPPAPSPTAAP